MLSVYRVGQVLETESTLGYPTTQRQRRNQHPRYLVRCLFRPSFRVQSHHRAQRRHHLGRLETFRRISEGPPSWSASWVAKSLTPRAPRDQGRVVVVAGYRFGGLLKHVTVVVFCAALSDYDQTLAEEQNRVCQAHTSFRCDRQLAVVSQNIGCFVLDQGRQLPAQATRGE